MTLPGDCTLKIVHGTDLLSRATRRPKWRQLKTWAEYDKQQTDACHTCDDDLSESNGKEEKNGVTVVPFLEEHILQFHNVV